MRYLHSFSERFIESRTACEIPISNLVIVSAIFLSYSRSLIFRALDPLAIKLIDNGIANPTKKNEMDVRRNHIIAKAKKYMLSFIWFVIQVSIAIILAYRAPWYRVFYSPSWMIPLFANFGYGMELVPSEHGTPIVIESEEKNDEWKQWYLVYACVQLGWYCQNFVEDTLWDRKRGDYWMIIIHHLIAISLIVMSIQGNYEYAGLIVLLPMDAMDLILYGGKLFHLCSNTIDGVPLSPRIARVQAYCMVVISIAWALTRLYMYSVIVYSWNILFIFGRGDLTVYDVSAPGDWKPVYVYYMAFLSIILAVLQYTWGYFIFKMTYLTFQQGTLKETVFNSYSQTKSKEQYLSRSPRGNAQNLKKRRM